MKLTLANIFILFPFLAFSQATTLTVNVEDCDGPASGTISVFEEANEVLYNLEEDPGEQYNVLSTYPAVTEEMKTLLSRIRSQGYSRA